ncbi:hypothetical protein [Streptomyces sp. NPDC045470]
MSAGARGASGDSTLGTDAHCQAGAQRRGFARIHDWLGDVMAESA